jgi:hypothetical protein
MKIDTLAFISCLLTSHEPNVFHQHIPALLPPVIAAVRDGFYKITAEALLVLQQLVQVIRPLDKHCNFDFKPFTAELYECTLQRLRAADIDQEVKDEPSLAWARSSATWATTCRPSCPPACPFSWTGCVTKSHDLPLSR